MNKRMVISATEAAEILATRQERVLELLYAGEIPAYREGRNWKIPLTALEEYVAERSAAEARARREAREVGV